MEEIFEHAVGTQAVAPATVALARAVGIRSVLATEVSLPGPSARAGAMPTALTRAQAGRGPGSRWRRSSALPKGGRRAGRRCWRRSRRRPLGCPSFIPPPRPPPAFDCANPPTLRSRIKGRLGGSRRTAPAGSRPRPPSVTWSRSLFAVHAAFPLRSRRRRGRERQSWISPPARHGRGAPGSADRRDKDPTSGTP